MSIRLNSSSSNDLDLIYILFVRLDIIQRLVKYEIWPIVQFLQVVSLSNPRRRRWKLEIINPDRLVSIQVGFNSRNNTKSPPTGPYLVHSRQTRLGIVYLADTFSSREC